MLKSNFLIQKHIISAVLAQCLCKKCQHNHPWEGEGQPPSYPKHEENDGHFLKTINLNYIFLI